MTSIGMAHGSDPTTASPIAWAVGGGDESQSGTFRALAWSQADDSVAEPLPYIGEDFEGFAAPAEDAVEPPSAPRYRRSTLLYGIAAGFVAVAVGGLVITVLNTGNVPTTTSPVVVQPAQSAVSPQQIRPTAPASGMTPVLAVPTASNSRPIAVNVPASTGAAVTPVAAKPPAPAAPAPMPAAPQAAAPQAAAPNEAAPEAAPQAEPPAALPPVAQPSLVSLPEVAPQPVGHPVGPTVFHVPSTPEGPIPPMVPDLGGSIPPIHVNVAPEGNMHPMVPNLGVPVTPVTPVIAVPAAPAASNPGITLNPGVTVPPMIPKLPAS